MTLRAANWSKDEFQTCYPLSNVRHNRMSISNLLAPSPTALFLTSQRESIWQPPSPSTFTENERRSQASPSIEPQCEADDNNHNPDSPPSKSQPPRRCILRRGHGATSMPRRSITASTAASRFGLLIQGRHYCTWVDPQTNVHCLGWRLGFSNRSDLIRHADSHHAMEEMHRLREGTLNFGNAQYVHTQEHLDALTDIVDSMSCVGCGMVFKSNRIDSKMRHLRHGACLRRQEREQKRALEKKKGRSPSKYKG
ncbi:hypothetical protein BU17DRAFT_71035 [Hysterangium stoloniferum]|nr:hypothetical protein BU17DRAFT_71035 [Hysterangium stoloniferum]